MKHLKTIGKGIAVAVGLMLCKAMNVGAQSVTYNHDAAKMNQITVGETGSGSLTPSLYYQTLHKSYSKSAASKNKLSYRTLAGVSLYNQVDEAEALDSAMLARAKIEALNVADRSGGALDVAWAAEGGKITDKMRDFERNINRILQTGGNGDDQSYWKEHYQMFQCAIKATQDAYMPNAQRKKEYLRIYEDVARQNEILVGYLAKRQNATVTNALLNATDNRTLHKGGIVRNAMSRWQESRLAVRGSQSGSNGNGEDDNESVNRGK